MIKSHLRESPGLHLDLANRHGMVDFYVDEGGNLVGRKLVSFKRLAESRYGGHGGDRRGCALPRAAELVAPFTLNYNFGRRCRRPWPANITERRGNSP